MFRPLERNMLDLDPPDHTRLRSLVHKAFTPYLVEKMRTRVQALADELLDVVGPGGEMDATMEDVTIPRGEMVFGISDLQAGTRLY